MSATAGTPAAMELEDGPGSLVFERGKTLSRGAVLDWARRVAAELPDAATAINLCEPRSHYLVGLLAISLRGGTCLMPPSRVPAAIEAVRSVHAGCCIIDDEWVGRHRDPGGPVYGVSPRIAPDAEAIVGYTSGSTGMPAPHRKTWAALHATTRRNSDALRMAVPALAAGLQPWLVATVPSQHMYGMEMAVLLPLLGGMGIHSGHPLFPADIADALAEIPQPRILVSTPVHLKTLVESGVQVPPLSAIVSATAPMSTELARAAEQRLGGVLVEFFGSTETCVIASRRPARETAWRPHDGVTLEHGDDCTIVSAPWLRQPIAMQDRLELGADGSFTVMGRSNDLVEVAGKRASLADLNRRLLAIPGVIDGAVLLPDDPAAVGVHRLAALVVAPSLQEQDIVHALAQQMDPVFIPRPLVRVERLPRNDTGKLPRSAALELLREARLRRQGLR